jgi:hypothetical protein
VSRFTTKLGLLLFLIGSPVAARAGPTRGVLNAGPALSLSAQTYEDRVRLPGMSFTVSGGLITRFAEPAWAFARVSYIRFGEGEFVAGSAGSPPRVLTSHMFTAMLGLEVEGNEQRACPFFSAGVGVGHVALGDREYSLPRHTVPGERMTAPAFSIGFGVRTGTLRDSPQASIGVEWLGILTDRDDTFILPVTIGVTF